MSVRLKQRFGEVLALVLIITIVGFLVYMLIPVSPKTPKSASVTVRSTAKIETQSHVAAVTDQTPPNSHALNETVAENVRQSSQSVPITVSNGNSVSKEEPQQQNNNAQSVGAAATAKIACTPLPKVVAKVSSVLQSIPIVGGLISDVTNCAS
jgi:hypothetical protein